MIQLIEEIPFFTPVYRLDNAGISLITLEQYVSKLEVSGELLTREDSGLKTRTYKQADTLLSELFELVSKCVGEISKTFGINKELTLTNYWVNVDKNNSFGTSHYHPEGVISGVFYIRVPDGSGCIEFERPDLQEHYFEADTINKYNYRYYKYVPNENLLLLFPSYLKHRITKSVLSNNEKRISISFNYS